MNDTISKPNVELLQRTLAYIEQHPEDWDQSLFRCRSGMCFAGHAATLAGGQWATIWGEFLAAEDADDPDLVHDGEIWVRYRAMRVLGLTDEQRDDLFDPTNSLDDLRRIVAEICEADPYPTIRRHRADLADKRHTITIERVDVETARDRFTGPEALVHVGELAVVERSNGRLTKVCCVESENRMDASLDTAARSYARAYSAAYIEAS